MKRFALAATTFACVLSLLQSAASAAEPSGGSCKQSTPRQCCRGGLHGPGSSAPKATARAMTRAFQTAMNAMASSGGGTVFVPEGHYAIKGTLTVPVGVTLRGQWAKPSPVRGSILLAFAGRGHSEGAPLLSLSHSSGLKELAIWYPEQDPARSLPIRCVSTLPTGPRRSNASRWSILIKGLQWEFKEEVRRT